MPAVAASRPALTRSDGYARHRPEETLLYQVVEAHWPEFRQKAEEEGGLPRFVVREFEEYLFSCKKRGWCPSCCGRRMADVAAHLVDDVLPKVKMRQWVCSLPWKIRTAVAFDRRLCADVLAAFADALLRLLRWRAKRAFGLGSVDDALVGAITFVQRCDGALRIDPHFHTLAADGTWVRDEQGDLRFRALDDPSPEEVAQLAGWTHARLVAEVGGVNVHASAAIDGRDRRRLERLCRYMARPPLCQKMGTAEYGTSRSHGRMARARSCWPPWTSSPASAPWCPRRGFTCCTIMAYLPVAVPIAGTSCQGQPNPRRPRPRSRCSKEPQIRTRPPPRAPPVIRGPICSAGCSPLTSTYVLSPAARAKCASRT